MTSACRTHHEIEVATKEPIRIDMNVRVDIYDHARAIERMVSGGTPPAFDKPYEEPAEETPVAPKKRAAESGRLGGGGGVREALMVVAADEEVSRGDYEAALGRRQARFPKLAPLKKVGKIGENHLGLLTIRLAVNAAEKGLADQENKDRMIIYRFQSEERKASLKEVQMAFAKVQREMAKSGEWIEVPNKDEKAGTPWVWVQKP